MSNISVIYFVFDTDSGSDISVRESFSSMGMQDFNRESVEFYIVAPERAAITEELVRETFDKFASNVHIVPATDADYSQNKLNTIKNVTGDIVAFADSDVIYPTQWLQRIGYRLSSGNFALAGPPRFKPGSILRTTLLLADFGLLWETQPPRARYMNLHNFAIRRDTLESIGLDDTRSPFHRFGLPSTLSRHLRQRKIPIRLDPAHAVTHGLNWKIWLLEKRLRRYAAASFMAYNDPTANQQISHGGKPDRPVSWLRLWWRWACVYQQRPWRCHEGLGLNVFDRTVQRALLAGLSIWELTMILFMASAPKFFERYAKRNDWW